MLTIGRYKAIVFNRQKKWATQYIRQYSQRMHCVTVDN